LLSNPSLAPAGDARLPGLATNDENTHTGATNMSNKNTRNENKPEEQPTTPTAQDELTDEQLEQVTGGFEPNSPATYPPGPTAPEADIQKKWLPAN
jgi:hypothetical protein